MDNPYNKRNQEQLYLAFEHSLNAANKEDNPYAPEDGDVYTAWMRGWNTTKASKKQAKAALKEVEDPYYEESLANKPTSIMSTEDLIAELKRRKAEELQQLLVQQAELLQKIKQLQAIMEL